MTKHWTGRFEAISSVAGVLARTPLADGRSEGEVLVCLLAGDELGSGPVESLTRLYVRKGRVEAHADFLRTLCRRAGVRVTVTTTGTASAARATVDVRRGDGTGGDATWTMKDAKRAGVDSQECWVAHPAAMLIARATIKAVRAHVSEILGPLGYTTEEGEEIERSAAARTQKRAGRSDPFPGEPGAPLRVVPPPPPETPPVPARDPEPPNTPEPPVDPEPQGDDTAASTGGGEDSEEPPKETAAAEMEPTDNSDSPDMPSTATPVPEGWSSIAEAELAHAHLVIEAKGLAADHPVVRRLAEVRESEGLMDRDRFVAARQAIETAVGEQGGGVERTDRHAEPQRRNGVATDRRSGATAAVPLAERVAVMAKRMDRGTRCV